MKRLKILHVYKAHSEKSSRIQAQLNIDNGSVLDINTGLNILKLVKIIKKFDRVVFHCQSGLLYLIVASFFIGFDKVRYDIHDYNEVIPSKGWRAFFRSLIFKLIESFIVRKVKICNVSESNKLLYGRGSVFMNIPSRAINYDLNKKSNEFIFFGKSERFPRALIEALKVSKKRLDVYGIFDQCLLQKYDVNYYGEYSPDQLNFLEKYKFSLIYYDGVPKKNMDNSLPNKFFQSIAYGMNICLSGNFVEMINFCNENFIPYYVVDCFTKFDELNFTPYHFDIKKLSKTNNKNYLDFIS